MTTVTLTQALQATAHAHGDSRGIRFYTSTSASEYRGYATLDRRARTIAAALQARGVRAGERAVLAVQTGLRWPDAVFGALYAGVAIVPAGLVGYGTAGALGERTAGLARAAEASLMITEPAALDRLAGNAEALPSLHLLDDLLVEGDPDAWTPPPLASDSIAFLLFTSGSTGDPKGAIGTHGTLLAAADACAHLFGMNTESVMVGWAPLHHAMGLVLQAISPAVLGLNSVVTSPEQFQRRPIFWLQLLSRHRGTTSVGGNFAFALCTQVATDEQIAELDLSHVTALISGSEPVRPETVTAFLERFRSTGLSETAFAPAMGMTEAMLVSAKPFDEILQARQFDRAALERGVLEDSEASDAVTMVSCGRPTRGTTLAIVDPATLAPLAEGAVGELWIASPMVGPGYFRRPDATAETFGHRLPGDDREYLRSGDLAALVDGELFITGRLKEVIIVRGRNLYPQDIEAAARSIHPTIGIGAAFEFGSGVGVVLEYNAEAAAASDLSLDEITAAVRAELISGSALPAVAVGLVEEGMLPRTPTGKVRRAATRHSVESGDLELIRAHGFATRPLV